jgi:hypothetical protein
MCKSTYRVWVSFLAAVPLICALSGLALARERNYCFWCCALLKIYSDPPGARVYDEDGDDWGLTSRNRPVDVFLSHGVSRDGGWCDKWPYKITVKDRQHGATDHHGKVRFYTSEADARSDPHEVTVVLMTGSTPTKRKNRLRNRAR